MISLKNNKDDFEADDSFIRLDEGDYFVKNLLTEEETVKASHLRYRVFCQELGWLPKSEKELEIDDYDNNAVFFGVFDGQRELLAYLRLIMPESPFMLEREFASLLGHRYKIRKEKDTAEVSRLCLAPKARKNRIFCTSGIYGVSIFLFKGVYHWCIRNGIRYLYAVAEQKIWRLFYAKGFPYKPIGELKKMPDGVIAVALFMDWKEFEILNSARRPAMLKWFTQSRSAPAQSLLRQPGVYSQHQVFARYS